MRDSRRQREMVVVGLTAAIGAVIANIYIQPIIAKKVKK